MSSFDEILYIGNTPCTPPVYGRTKGINLFGHVSPSRMTRITRAYKILQEDGVVTLINKMLKAISPIERIYWSASNNRQKGNKTVSKVLFYVYIGLGILYYLIIHHKIVQKYENCWVLSDIGSTNSFHSPSFRELSKGTKEYKERLRDIYQKEDFVEVEKNDVVVEIGSYLGVFTKEAARNAKIVIAVDPYYAIGNCHQGNFNGISNIRTISKAMWDKEGKVELNLSYNPSELSIMDVDSRATGETVDIKTDTVTNLMMSEGLRSIDFLKIEAEGTEPEILSGAINAKPSKIAIQANEERGGKSSMPEVIEILQKYNYQIERDNQRMMVYAKLEPE